MEPVTTLQLDGPIASSITGGTLLTCYKSHLFPLMDHDLDLFVLASFMDAQKESDWNKSLQSMAVNDG